MRCTFKAELSSCLDSSSGNCWSNRWRRQVHFKDTNNASVKAGPFCLLGLSSDRVPKGTVPVAVRWPPAVTEVLLGVCRCPWHPPWPGTHHREGSALLPEPGCSMGGCSYSSCLREHCRLNSCLTAAKLLRNSFLRSAPGWLPRSGTLSSLQSSWG